MKSRERTEMAGASHGGELEDLGHRGAPGGSDKWHAHRALELTGMKAKGQPGSCGRHWVLLGREGARQIPRASGTCV